MSFKFPIRTFGKDSKERSFKPQWYQNYARLYSDVILDKAFCHTCITATKLGKISAAKSKEAFTKTRFQNWKESLEKNFGLAKHNDSTSHKKASEDKTLLARDSFRLLKELKLIFAQQF